MTGARPPPPVPLTAMAFDSSGDLDVAVRPLGDDDPSTDPANIDDFEDGEGHDEPEESAASTASPSASIGDRWRRFDRPRSVGRRTVRPHTMLAYAALGAFLAVTARNCHTLQEPGHDWGDDFALYARQAKSLIEGNPGQVVADTRFAVTESGWAFSPNAYPWGWPILLAPGVLLWGLNYSKLKVITTAMLLLSFVLLFRFVARRAGYLGALALLVLFGTNMFYLGWTNTILSEFAFLASAVLSLLALDRYRTSGSLRNAARTPAILVGLSLAWTMNVRREGAGLVAGLVVLQVVEFWSERRSAEIRGLARRELLTRVATPYTAFLAAIVAFQLVLPTDLLPNAGKSGLVNVRANLSRYRLYLAEHLGLKDPGDYPLRWVHNVAVGETVFLVVASLALIGIVLRCIVAPRLDAFLAAAVLGHAYIVLSAPFSEGRYLYALSPWVGYFALQAPPSIVAAIRNVRGKFHARRRHGAARTAQDAADPVGPRRSLGGARLVAAIGLVVLAWSNMPGLRNALAYHRDYTYIENGPDSVAAVDMFANVATLTRPNDIILFFRARAMMLYADRRAVQGGDLKRLSAIADWYVMAKNSTYGQRLVAPAEASSFGLTMEWENAEWVLWRISHPVAAEPTVDSAFSTVPTLP